MKTASILALLTLIGSPVASATIIYSGIRDIPIPLTLDGVYIDIDDGSTSSSEFAGWDINPFLGGYAIFTNESFQPKRTGTGSLDAIVNVSFDSLLDGTGPFSTGTGGSDTHLGSGPDEFGIGTEGYIGFEFALNGSADLYNGWMRVILTNNTLGGIVHDWAYEDSGGAIAVGANGGFHLPEAGLSVAIICLVWSGLIGLSRRRSKVGASARHT